MRAAYGGRTERAVKLFFAEKEKAKQIERQKLIQAQKDILALQAKLKAMQLAKFPGVVFLKQTTFQRIEERAMKVFQVSRNEIRSQRRTREIVFARQFIMYWAARQTILSLPAIGQRIGGRDHTTILHGIRTYPEKRKAQGRFVRRIETGARHYK